MYIRRDWIGAQTLSDKRYTDILLGIVQQQQKYLQDSGF
jgi:hypothetical protein